MCHAKLHNITIIKDGDSLSALFQTYKNINKK